MRILLLFLLLAAPAYGKDFVLDPTIPETHSPCMFDIDASWLKSVKRLYTNSGTWLEQSFHCDGAVLKGISVESWGEIKSFQFIVGLRSGHDRDGTVQFSLLDNNNTIVAFGEVSDNLDEGKESHLQSTLKITNKDFDHVFANRSSLHITLRVEKPE